MPGLDSQNVPIALNQGLDTKTDPKQLQPGKMLVLQNCSFKSPDELSKRDGFNGLTQTILSGGSVSNGVGIGSFKNELLSLDGSSLYSYSPDASAQVNQGMLIPLSLSVQPIIRNTNQQTEGDSAYHAGTGLQCFIWNDSGSGGVNYSIFDSTTNTILVSDAVVFATATLARVLTVGNYFVIIYADSVSHHLIYKSINTASPTTLSSPTTIATDLSTAVQAFDATIINALGYIVYRIGTTQLGFYSLSTSLVLSTKYTVTTGLAVDAAITIAGDASNNVWVSYTASGSGTLNIYGLIVNSALTTTLLANTIVSTNIASSGFTSYNITMAIAGTTATIYYEQNDADFNWIRFNTLTFSGTAGTDTLFIRNMSLGGKVFVYNGSNYIIGVYGFNPASTYVSIEPTYFIFNSSAQVIAKIAPSTAGGYYHNGILPQIIALSSTRFSFTYLVQDDLSSLMGNVFYKSGIQSATIDFNLPNPMPKIQFGENLLLGSGQLWQYDGVNVVEQGFHLYPEKIVPAVAVTSGGGIGSGVNNAAVNQMQYIALYEWVDQQGQLHRSAPSVAVTLTLPQNGSLSSNSFNADTTVNSAVLTSVSSTGGVVVGQVYTGTGLVDGSYVVSINAGASTITMSSEATADGSTVSFTTYDVCQNTVEVMTLQPTLKQNVSIVLYRTQNNATVFYRVSSLTSLTYNTTADDVITFTDVLPDSLIIGNEQLYTTGGTVDNINPPAITALASFKERVVYLSPENPFQFGYSQQVIDGVPVEFNSLEFVQNIDQRIVRASAIAPMDDKIILFGPSRKFYVVGTGPSPNGTNNDFTDTAPIAGVSGCSNPIAVLELPTGLIYQDAEKGFWLLDRSLQEHYIGDAVEAFNNQTVTSAVLFPNATKAMFTLNSGTNLIYDYYLQQWETDIFPSVAVDATLFENDVCYIQANGLVLQQTPGTFSDNGALIPIGLTTGWMSFSGVQGYQRVWELVILGTYKSPHTLTVNIYTDYSVTPTTTKIIPVLSDPGLYQYRIRPNVQKCETIQVQILESQSGSIGEGLSISNLAFRVGVKKGMNKLPAGQSY